jgi:hypothetical protein
MFKRCGGFIGTGMRFQVDLDQLPINDAHYIVRLIEQPSFHPTGNLIIKFNPMNTNT